MPRGRCSIKGCNLPHYARSWCRAHYVRWRKTGDPRPKEPIAPRNSRIGLCSVKGCERPIMARRLCVGHVRRLDKTGSVQADKPLKVNRPQGQCTVPGCTRSTTAYSWCTLHYEPFKRYRLDPASFQRLLEAQGRRCAICRRSVEDGAQLTVDHDHACCNDRKKYSCGRCNRGLLCGTCNMLLGGAHDNPAILLAAVDYLRSWANAAAVGV